MLSQLQIGPQANSDGANPVARGIRTGEMAVSEVHGRFFEQNYRGNVYSFNAQLTALSANTIALSATSTPIIGLWNPSTNTINVVVLQAYCGLVLNTLTTPVAPGPLYWAASVGNTAVSTGSAPLNRKTLSSSGSSVKAFGAGTALTGLTNNVAAIDTFPLTMQPSGQTAGTIAASTASAQFAAGFAGFHNFDGSLIIPPGGVLSLVNTTSTTTYSANATIVWEEVPV